MRLTSLSRHEPENRFLVYSAFAWIPAALFTGIIFVVNKVWENDPHHWNWMPIVGFSACVLVGMFRRECFYEKFLINFLLKVLNGLKGSSSWIMFILTIRHIQKVKKEVKYFEKRQDGTSSCLEFDGET
ncbi:probable G-protein coupled receptor Mth-like 12 [Drosophila eugracilis]|uniref:probable G-protein coupled receptor Mth-like 12 n=1 Tax=Drosophila eugracilis TaxID=29029 RepID=UPI001BD9B87B|nr:probable G-protein coupled receptor Mth-like 12 [Drosophila eugracilis]